MPVLDRIASALQRRDDIPNQELARELVRRRDIPAIQEIAANLANKDARVASDCLKVLYEVGYLAPGLIEEFLDVFLALLSSSNNRMVWGAAIALATIAPLQPGRLFAAREPILAAMARGSVIAADNCVKALALVSAADPAYGSTLFPLLLAHLGQCRSKDVPQRSEKVLAAVHAGNREAFVAALLARIPDLQPSEQARVNKLIKLAQSR